MATPSSLPQTLVQAPTGDTLARVRPRRTLRGFANLLLNETRAWWGQDELSRPAALPTV
jgi:hypothetical protein